MINATIKPKMEETKVIKMYGGKVVINFTERDWAGKKIHVYTGKNGEKILSVTGVTGTIDKSNALIPWATKLMGKYLSDNFLGKILTGEALEVSLKEWRKEKSEAADIGTAIHDWIRAKIKGEEPAIPEDDKVRNGVIAFLKWTGETKIKWLESEKIVYSKKHDYVGTLDAIAKIGGKKYLIDYKSSKGLYPEFYLQTAGYQIAYEEEHGQSIDGRILIHLGKEDGAFEAREIGDYEEDRDAFLGLLKTKKRLQVLDTWKN